MKFSRRDYLTMGAVILLVGVLALGTLKGQGQSTPFDDLHRPSYLAIKNGQSQKQVELVCTTCHSKSSMAFTKRHPPKEQCLICHKLKTDE